MALEWDIVENTTRNVLLQISVNHKVANQL
jgi:hypothetical protein